MRIETQPTDPSNLSRSLFRAMVDCQFVGGSSGRIRIVHFSRPPQRTSSTRELCTSTSRALGIRSCTRAHVHSRDENPHARTHAGSMIHLGELALPRNKEPTDRERRERQRQREGERERGEVVLYQLFLRRETRIPSVLW